MTSWAGQTIQTDQIDTNGSSRPDDPDGSGGLDDLDGPSRPDDPNGPGGPKDTNKSNGPDDPDK